MRSELQQTFALGFAPRAKRPASGKNPARSRGVPACIFTNLCGYRPPRPRLNCAPMKRLIPLLLLLAASLSAEEVTLKQPALLKADRHMVSLKAGTVVELVSRDGSQVTIKYHNLTGKIPASKLEEPAAAAPAPAAKPAGEKLPAGKPTEAKPANPPQTTYGKAVQKAKDNAAAHEKNVAKPADEVLKDQ